MSATVIKDFLVALNWKTDAKGAKDADEALKNTEERANKLRLALNAMALAAVAAVVKTADEMEKLYFASQRIGASAENIRGFQNAISQMGGSAEGAIQSLESLAQKIRQSPGMEKMVQSVGVATRDANGAMRDQVDIYRDLGKQMSKMEYYRANAYSNAFGWDEATLMAVRDPAFGKNLDKYSELQKKLGMSNELAKSGKDFAYEWRELKTTLSTMGQVVMMNLGQALIPILKAINSGLQTMIGWWAGLDEGTKQFIKSAAQFVLVWLIFSRVLSVLKGMFGMLKSISKFGFGKFGDKLADLGKKVPILGKLGKFLSKIFKGLGGLAGRIPILGALVGLVKKLGLAFMAFGWPIRLIMLLGAALYYLWEDFQVWKEGGEALFDWSGVVAGLEAVRDIISDIIKRFASLGKAAEAFASGKILTAGKLLAQAFSPDSGGSGEAGSTEAATSSGGGAIGTAAVAGAAVAGAFGAKTIAKTALKRFPLIAAGLTGYEVGGAISENFVEGTSFGDKLGEGIARSLAFFGVDSAKEAVALQDKNKAILEADAGNSVSEVANKAADKVGNKVTQVVDKIADKVSEKSLGQAATDIMAKFVKKGSEFSDDVKGGLSRTVAAAGGAQPNPSVKSKGFTAEKGRIIAEVAKRIGVDPNHLAAVISFETAGTFSTNIRNPTSSATGLIQFMDDRSRGGKKGVYFGKFTRDQFGALSFEEQMKYVELYFKKRGFDGSKKRDLADTYTAVTGYGYKKGEAAYDLNPLWDTNNNHVIEKGEAVLNPAFKAHQKKFFIDARACKEFCVNAA